MKRLRILGRILKHTGADKILITYVIFVLAFALVVLLAEPHIHHYGDAFWYCYAVLSTVGFGDVLATTAIVKIGSVVLTLYTIIVVAIVTGVIVNFYTQIMEARKKNELKSLLETFEHLPELSKQELEEISKNAAQIKERLF